MKTSKLIYAIESILIDEGQHDPKFNWGDTIRYSPSEVGNILRRRADELEDEMEKTNDYKIGDEVAFRNGTKTKFVITYIHKDGSFGGIGADGVAFCDKNPEKWIKTGRYFPEAKALMDALSK